MQDFTGKTVVITGGGSGIGAATCELFASEGSRVVVADIELDKAGTVAGDIVKKGGTASAVHVDITSTESCDALARATRDLHGDTHLLVANAGVLMLGTLATRTEKDWQWVFDVNVFGTIRTINAFMPQLKRNSGDAHIVITCSMAGLMASAPGKGVYNASKHALMSYGETLRDELAGSGINVSLLLPGGTISGITDSERNRPPESGRGAPISDEEFATLLSHLGETGEAVTPEECIRGMLRGLRNNETWINPGSSQQAAIEARFRRVIKSFDQSIAR